jgi:SAM-dependent methyltransferase
MSISDLSEEGWLEILKRSVREPYLAGLEFPRFPCSQHQLHVNGRADEGAMEQAYALWLYASRWAVALGRPLNAHTKVLDFGCGWGRGTRLFMKDVSPPNIFGVDIDPNAIALCKGLGVPGSFYLTSPAGRLPFDNATFEVIISSSVFTHMPEAMADATLAELSRVAAPNCLFVLTVEGENFLDALATTPSDTPILRWQLMLKFQPEIDMYWQRWQNGEFCYFPTNSLSADFYGDAAIPPAYIRTVWRRWFALKDYVDQDQGVGQAVVIGVKEA